MIRFNDFALARHLSYQIPYIMPQLVVTLRPSNPPTLLFRQSDTKLAQIAQHFKALNENLPSKLVIESPPFPCPNSASETKDFRQIRSESH